MIEHTETRPTTEMLVAIRTIGEYVSTLDADAVFCFDDTMLQEDPSLAVWAKQQHRNLVLVGKWAARQLKDPTDHTIYLTGPRLETLIHWSSLFTDILKDLGESAFGAEPTAEQAAAEELIPTIIGWAVLVRRQRERRSRLTV